MSLKITFIGAGNMARSLAGGMIAKGMDPINITLSDINEQALQEARSQLQVNTTRDNVLACQKADIVVIAVKPQVVAEAMAPLQTLLQQRQPLLISIAAGITIARLQQLVGAELPVVRCMPNTPALVQAGATGLYANERVSDIQREQARGVLSSVGLALWLESEDQIDAVTALSGSGPAYFFYIMEAMTKAGVALGLPESVAVQLTLQTALGSAQIAITSDQGAAELRRQVTSPGGTTERAIGILDDKGCKEHIKAAIEGAYQRSKELAGN